MITLDDVVGYKETVGLLKEHLIKPYKENKSAATKRILFYGPPAVGKTFIAKAVAGELGLRFDKIASDDDAATILKVVDNAMDDTLLYIDEVDGINYRPLLQEVIDSIPKDILVVAATNYPWKVTELFKSGYNSIFLLPLPDEEARAGLFAIYLDDTEADIKRLASITQGFSSVDVYRVCEYALYKNQLATKDLETIIEGYEPVRVNEWIREAKSNKDKLPKEEFKALNEWLKGN